MARLRVGITMSLDGYVAGPDQSMDEPARGRRRGAPRVGPTAARAFQRVQGREGEETGLDDDVLAETFADLGATIMGRNMFGGGPRPVGRADPWTGWWGT